MPALPNARQERFCQLVKQGVPPYRAYPLAGYKPDEGAPYRLSGNVRVKRRLSELTRAMAMKTRVTIETITAELDEARSLAMRCDQPSAAISATATKAKLHGLIVDRKESGAPGDFAGLQSEQAVLDKVREEMGDETALLLTAALAKGQPEVEAEPEPEVAGPGDTVN